MTAGTPWKTFTQPIPQIHRWKVQSLGDSVLPPTWSFCWKLVVWCMCRVVFFCLWDARRASQPSTTLCCIYQEPSNAFIQKAKSAHVSGMFEPCFSISSSYTLLSPHPKDWGRHIFIWSKNTHLSFLFSAIPVMVLTEIFKKIKYISI